MLGSWERIIPTNIRAQPMNIEVDGTVFSIMLSNTTEKSPSVAKRSDATAGGVNF